MSTPFAQRWVALLAIPLAVLGAVTLHLTTAVASVQPDRFTTAENTSVLPMRVAQRSRVQRMRFANGEDSATVKTSVVNGTRDMYLLGAQKGQTMQVKITSLENNAVFDVVAPPNQTEPRRVLKQEAVTWNKVLPATGDYQIVVGSTRGNASYRLEVTIR
ncbi:MAG: hypothetical protein KME42_13055 [Tildeniella nuda ZEHNDER 1965/U140]|nr:hypothetical protein [Tildeniella nuda ZEHNDER 1965/U140]